jgi:hypothetical protein
VSYAWQLPISATTWTLPSYSKDLAVLTNGVTATALRAGFNKLQPGDIINNKLSGGPGGEGHVVIFVNWLDQTRTSFLAYDENVDTGATRYELAINANLNGDGNACESNPSLSTCPLSEQSVLYPKPVEMIANGPFYPETYNQSVTPH